MSTPAAPSPRSGSARARVRIAATSSTFRPRSTTTFDRESSAAFPSNDGFSVVAPMSTMSPASTRGRNASCWALLNRWISSINTMVRRPVERRRRSASLMTSRISLIPARTALKDTNLAFVVSAMMRASVVLPVPGGPHRMMDCRRSRSIASRSGLPGASSSPWPTNSSKVRGRIRSGSGDGASRRGASSGNSESTLAPCFVHDQRRADRGVQRLDRWPHRDHHALVGGVDLRRRQAGPFAPDENRDGAAQIGGEERVAAAGGGGDDAAPVTAGFLRGCADISMDENRQPEGAAHRPAQRLPPERIGARAGADETSRTAGFRHSDDGSHISRVLYVDRDDHERCVSIDALARAERPLGESHDGARRSNGAERLHDRGGNGRNGNVVPSQPRRKISHVRPDVSDTDDGGLAYAQTGAERFGDQMHAVEQNQIGARALRGVAKARDDGILSARDGGHAGRIALWYDVSGPWRKR